MFVGHALVGLDYATLFVAEGKVDETLRAVLADGVDVAGYAQAAEALGSLELDQTLLIDPACVTCGVFHAMNPDVPRVEAINPSTLLKSRKTEAELANVRQAMEQDGAALCEFFAWFEGALGKERITELTIDEQITAARARRPGYVCPSFATIAGFNANGAMPHYRATAESHAVIEGDGLLLIDSGGQYLGGTTDITRVVAVGAPSADQKVDFTLVLKGMIALSRASFPRGTPSPMLDAIARAPIWEGGAEYGHGTGHGVGYFLNVHEGPQVISYRAAPGPHTAMEPGMITSNEPGIYRPPLGRAHREPGGQPQLADLGTGRVPVLRDADAVPDRYALHRAFAVARRRARLAQRLSQDGVRAPVAAGRGRCPGVADAAL